MPFHFVPEFRNPKRNQKGSLDCEINHPTLGWIPFTCDPDDASPPIDSLKLTAAIEEAGNIAAYTPPAPPPADTRTATEKFEKMASRFGLTADELATEITKRTLTR